MANMTRYLQKALLDHLFGFSTFSAPAAVWLSLHTELLTDASAAGDDEVSISGTGYGRLSLNALMTETDLTTGISFNDLAITIGPASSDWGFITAVGFNDAETGGNLLMWVDPTTPKLVVTGQSFVVAVNLLTIRFD